ncbi:hypothetical protein [Natrialbaceae archaeon AArc-T1-2]|uniref:hypothetical protein n=1 Tax=Natrialbaceae archaeon AArc-T1-2 TaxID=3053904 RepID=UPI00255B18C3|nr:hypothetical protein [Natrialbaceae archaeon AArc-T1-2]WIV68839.1 hypothetical protein QQ977_16185 [Natrialbaceae archaeon AArc-T1-2]
MYAFDGGHEPRRVAHEALRQIRTELSRHPAITGVEGLPHDTLHKELRATVDPAFIGADTPKGTLTVRWIVGDPADPPRFIFHFSDESGFDCGWHHHEQDHVDGWGHFQEREHEQDEYTYRAFQFGSTEPSRVVWEVLDELQTVLQE